MRSVFGRQMLSHIAVILVTLVTLGLFMSYLVRNHVIEMKRRDLTAKGEAVVALLLPRIEEGRPLTPNAMNVIQNLVGAMMWVSDPSGNILAGAPPERWRQRFPEDQKEIRELFAGQEQVWIRKSRRQPDPSIVVGIPLTISGSPAALFLYSSITGVNQTAEAIDRLLIYSLLIGLAAAVLFGLIMSRSVTRPIADISHAARSFARGKFDSRANVKGNDELGELGRVFNSMAASLAHIEQNRREFLANVSHELKTPVTCIQAMAETLQDGLITNREQQDRYLNNIVKETHYIGRLIQDLLDLSQLEAGELSINPATIDLAEFLAASTGKFDALLKEKNLTLATEISGSVPPVAADPVRLLQVITNLISNAARYSPEHSNITLRVLPSVHQVSLAVADQGFGIPAKDLPYIWDRFYRVEKSRARTAGGTGLGLSITKQLVQSMGGDIEVASTEGKGTVFTFTLPLAAKNQ